MNELSILLFWPYHVNWWGFPGLIILSGFIILIVVLVKNNQNQNLFNNRNIYPGDINTNSESALDILNKRYAKGEITKEQYDQMKKDIGL